ncbi:MAG: class I SAM-dependent methyltransferase [Candidatus Gottesmanbacteria bacterium]|nr:class I SAM-dependent methyltransferase [Candidatus Gottesmanbacteria bacterium]
MKCYLCGHHMKVFLNKNGYTIYRCETCGLGKTDLKKPYELFVAEYYTKGYFTGDPVKSAFINYKDDKRFTVKNMKQFLARVKKYKSKGTLLDVGCALGFFVELALQAGFDAYGVDPSSYAVGEAKKLVGGGRIKTGTIEAVEYPEKSFDVITLFDVFEHLDDPGSDIEKLSKFLKDDGIIVIATGDTESVMAKVLKRRWTFYIPPQHLFFFNKTTLTALLGQYGLVPVEWFRIGKWLSLRYVLHLARTTGESNFAHSIYRWMESYRIEQVPLYLPVGDNMVTIVKKLKRDNVKG